MGSPLSPAIANFFMEDFEEKALNSAPMRPKCFFRYVDDTFIIWPHGLNTLNAFLEHMNNQHPNIRFTMEIEKNHRRPFLDILIHRKRDGRLGHSVYRKPTHTDLYLNGNSHHHPAQRDAVLSSLTHRAKAVADKESLPADIKHLKKTFLQNGYGERQILLALRRAEEEGRRRVEGTDKKPLATACLPYVSTVSGKISRILRRFNIATIHVTPAKIRHQLVNVRDPIGLKTPGVYQIPCECGEVYVGETGRTIETRLKEHKRHLRLAQLEKSAIAKHSVGRDQAINWDGAKLLCRARGYWDRLVELMAVLPNFLDSSLFFLRDV
ncbi:uncharacterized protein [Hetaerina americana]|uniref:uncharacterized protein n=1 Tax=Hetaerina americana TaxID=62018 RepID=UPI003A7F1B99